MRRPSTILAVIIVVLATTPAHAGRAADPQKHANAASHPGRNSTEHVRYVDGPGAQRLVGMSALERLGKPATAADLERTITAQLRGPNPDKPRFVQLSPRQESAPEETRETSFGYPVPDLDGDLKSDVLIETYGNSSSKSSGLMVEARSGTTGEMLWKVGPYTEGEHQFLLVGVFDSWADGRTRVIVLRYDFEPLFHPSDFCGVDRRTIPIRSDVTSVNPDGSEAFTRSFEGAITTTEVCPIFDAETGLVIEKASGILVGLGTSGDVNGSGHADLFAQTEDFRYRNIVGRVHFDVTSTAHTFDDRNGREIASFSVDAPASMTPVPDVNGDGLGDIVVISGAQWSARSAGGAKTYWTEPLDLGDAAAYWIEPATVRPGHPPDLVIWTISIDDWDCGPNCIGFIIIFGRGTFVYEGATGTSIWGREAARDTSPFGYFVDVPSFTGDEGVDFYEIGFESGPHTESSRSSIRELDGGSGAVLYGPEIHEATGSEGTTNSLDIWVSGDLDGDGVIDFQVTNWSFKPLGVFDYEFVHADQSAFSGASRDRIWTREDLTDPRDVMSPLADVNGDGTTDLFEAEEISDDNTVLRFFDGRTLTELWVIGPIDTTAHSWLYLDADDFTGDGALDVFLETFEDGDELSTATIRVFDRSLLVWNHHIAPTYPF